MRDADSDTNPDPEAEPELEPPNQVAMATMGEGIEYCESEALEPFVPETAAASRGSEFVGSADGAGTIDTSDEPEEDPLEAVVEISEVVADLPLKKDERIPPPCPPVPTAAESDRAPSEDAAGAVLDAGDDATGMSAGAVC